MHVLYTSKRVNKRLGRRGADKHHPLIRQNMLEGKEEECVKNPLADLGGVPVV